MISRLSPGKRIVSQPAFALVRSISTRRDCSLFKRIDGSQLYPGPQATLRNRPCLPGAASATFPEYLNGPREDFPVFLQANRKADLSIKDWAEACREQLDVILLQCSAVAFRGLPLSTPDDFNEFSAGCDYGNLAYVNGTAVRDQVLSHTYNASLEPPEFSIELHNELSYTSNYNHKISFFCLVAPRPGEGGISCIAKNSDIFNAIDPIYVEKLRDKGILYHRNLDNDARPAVLSWQNGFAVTTKEEAEEAMLSRGIGWTWLDGDRLSLRYGLDAFTMHPDTGEELWFNQVQSSHASYYKAHPDFIGKEMSNLEYPFHATYGDGEEFEEDFVKQVREVSWECAVGFPWEQGDVMILDNMAAQHSRLSFTGQRKVLVSLSGARVGQAHHGRRSAASM